MIRGENTTRLVILNQKLRDMKYGGSIVNLLTYFEGIVQDYRVLNGTLSDTELTYMLLSTLPPKYAMYKLMLRKESIEKHAGMFDLEAVVKLLRISSIEIKDDNKSNSRNNKNSSSNTNQYRPNKNNSSSSNNNSS